MDNIPNKNHKLELNFEEFNNLLVFLQRVNLNGQEAFVYCNLVQKIQQMLNKKDGD